MEGKGNFETKIKNPLKCRKPRYLIYLEDVKKWLLKEMKWRVGVDVYDNDHDRKEAIIDEKHLRELEGLIVKILQGNITRPI